MNRKFIKIINLLIHIAFATVFVFLGVTALVYEPICSMSSQGQMAIIWSRVFEGIAGIAVFITGIFHFVGLFKDYKWRGDNDES